MRQYPVPITIEEKERVIGGILTFGEFGYLVGGGLIGLVVFIALSPISKIIGVIFGVIVGLIGVPFAFYRPHGYTLVKYWKYKKEFNKKNKKLPNKRNL